MAKKPIILIPGIQGTKLFDVNQKDFKTVWSGIRKFFTDIHQLTLRSDGINDKELDTVIERADVEDAAYSEIIHYLKSQGYRVFIFGYDWRKSNTETARDLKQFVDRLKIKFSNTNSFNFLTHSMGGLVFSAYMNLLTPQEREQTVNRAVLTVPPFLGSVEAAVNLVIGKSMLFNSSDDFRKVARTFPAIYELLPVYADAYTFANTNTQAQFNPYDFDTYWQQVKNVNVDATEDKHALMRMRLQSLSTARAQNHFVFDFANASTTLQNRIIVVVGDGCETRQKINVINNHNHYKYFFEFEDKPSVEAGDGTVPFVSATAFKATLDTYSIRKNSFETWLDSHLLGADLHAFFLNNSRSQNIILRFFDGRDTSTNWFNSADNGVSKVT